MLIRLATKQDIPALDRLIPLSVRALSSRHYTLSQIEAALIKVFGVDSQLIADGTYYVADVGGEIVGCGGWSKRTTLYGGDQSKPGEPEPLLDAEEDPARIRAFFVHPDWTRRGIARQILEACESAALESGFRRMELVATLPGEPLYAAFGYDVAERFAIELRGGEELPVARMTKPLPEQSPR
jgi:predicted N-acetyltransferase YhbS